MTSRRPPAKPNPFGPRLTDDQREEILAAFRQGTSIIKLAAKYGVSKQAISLLAKRRGVKNETKALLPSAAEATLMLHRCGLTPKDAGALASDGILRCADSPPDHVPPRRFRRANLYVANKQA